MSQEKTKGLRPLNPQQRLSLCNPFVVERAP
jgi:hypothetical protein